jgi:hypothetical protein
MIPNTTPNQTGATFYSSNGKPMSHSMVTNPSPIPFRQTTYNNTSPRFNNQNGVYEEDESNDLNDRVVPNHSLEIDDDIFTTPYHNRYQSLVSIL